MLDSPSNPVVKMLRSLTTSKGRREHGLFLVEGVRAVEDGLKAGRYPRVLLYDRDALTRTERGKALLRLVTSPRERANWPAGANVQEASERAIEAATETQHPQGVVAAFEMAARELPTYGAARPALALVCDEIQDPGNLGTMLRTAEAAGVTTVLLSPGCVDPYNPKAVRAGMGAHFRLPVVVARSWGEVGEKLHDLSIEPARVFATEAAAQSPYDAVNWTLPAALIISNEAHGLSPQAGSMAASFLSIPMLGQTESLNAATAAAVVLFEAARQRRAASEKERSV